MVDEAAKPRVLVAIPTGCGKAYALQPMIDALNKLEGDFDTLFAVTVVKDNQKYRDFYLKVAVDALSVDGNGSSIVASTELSPEEQATPFMPIVKNRQLIRSYFLDGDYDYLLLCGGDNPPAPDAITRLKALDADIALGVSYQRPAQSRVSGNPYPLLYKPVWTPAEVFDQHLDLEPENREQFTKIFRHRTFLAPLYALPELADEKVIYGVVGGDGNGLYTRRVLEAVGWSWPQWESHSEDIHFQIEALAKGYTTAADMTYHVAHLDPDGSEY